HDALPIWARLLHTFFRAAQRPPTPLTSDSSVSLVRALFPARRHPDAGRKEQSMRFAVRSTVVAACMVFLAATVSAQATVQLGGTGSLTFKGFFSATAFAQDQNFAFGNGQNAAYPVGAECDVDCWFGGADIRNTRLTMVFDG